MWAVESLSSASSEISSLTTFGRTTRASSRARLTFVGRSENNSFERSTISFDFRSSSKGLHLNHIVEHGQLEEGNQDGRSPKRAKPLAAQPALHKKQLIGVPPSMSSSSSKVHDSSGPPNILPEWEHLSNLREQALEKEREKSDPHGQWLEQERWAFDTLAGRVSAKPNVPWADLDEASLILGEVDDSRAWVEKEDKDLGVL